MKKLVVEVICACMCASIWAANAKAKTNKSPLTPEQKAALELKRLEKTGGIIMKEGTGKVLVVNAQKKYSVADIDRNLEQFRKALSVKMEVRDGSWKFGDPKPADGNVVLYVVDDATLPMSLVAMEAHWGVVNVSRLDGEKRFDREFTRTAIATFSAGVSQYKVSPMQPVSSPSDLDSLVGNALTVDATMGMSINFKGIGITKTRMSTYRRACQEGWANSPTNKYQKAIWDEIHAMPTKPLAIEPEKAK